MQKTEVWEKNFVDMMLAAAQDGDAQERAVAKNELFRLTKSSFPLVQTAAWNALRKIPK